MLVFLYRFVKKSVKEYALCDRICHTANNAHIDLPSSRKMHSNTIAYAENYGQPLPIYMYPSVVLGIVIGYLLLIKFGLPWLMRRRGNRPYELRTFMLVYNVGQLLVNGYMAAGVSVTTD